MNKIQKEIERLTGPELEKEVRMIEEESEQIVVFETIDIGEMIINSIERAKRAKKVMDKERSRLQRFLNWLTKKR